MPRTTPGPKKEVNARMLGLWNCLMCGKANIPPSKEGCTICSAVRSRSPRAMPVVDRFRDARRLTVLQAAATPPSSAEGRAEGVGGDGKQGAHGTHQVSTRAPPCPCSEMHDLVLTGVLACVRTPFWRPQTNGTRPRSPLMQHVSEGL